MDRISVTIQSDWRWEMGYKQCKTGDWRREIENGLWEMGDRRWKIGYGRWEIGDRQRQMKATTRIKKVDVFQLSI